MKVYVVTYQSYIYPYDMDQEIKYIMNENFEVKGVFSSKKKAESFIKKYLRQEAIDFCGNNRKDVKEFIEKYTDHYDVFTFELDEEKDFKV